MLGLTIHCARCHDHKFDPIKQADYYRMLAFLTPSRRYDREADDESVSIVLASDSERTRVAEMRSGRRTPDRPARTRGSRRSGPRTVEAVAGTTGQLPAALADARLTPEEKTPQGQRLTQVRDAPATRVARPPADGPRPDRRRPDRRADAPHDPGRRPPAGQAEVEPRVPRAARPESADDRAAGRGRRRPAAAWPWRGGSPGPTTR